MIDSADTETEVLARLLRTRRSVRDFADREENSSVDGDEVKRWKKRRYVCCKSSSVKGRFWRGSIIWSSTRWRMTGGGSRAVGGTRTLSLPPVGRESVGLV